MKNGDKTHTTNYYNTFIEVSEDCPVSVGEAPPVSEKSKSVARLQFELLSQSPYQYTSDELFFQVHAIRNDIGANELDAARAMFFSKGQPCFRASPLAKRYGWGIHNDAAGKVALVGVHSAAYEQFASDDRLKLVRAMRFKRK